MPKGNEMGWSVPTFSKLALISMIMMLSACGPVLRPIPPEITKVTVPEIGSLQTRDIGVPLIEEGQKHTYEALIPSKDMKTNMPFSNGYLTYEGEMIAKMNTDGKKWYCGRMVYVSTDGDRDSKGNSCQNVNDLEKKWNMPKGTYEIKTVSRIYLNNFQMNLIYTGKRGNEIYITYREFKNDWSRPSFTQNLTFDLSESRIIGMKGARIEVIEATNTNIRYKIISGFTVN